jgi:putative oxidoreductase
MSDKGWMHRFFRTDADDTTLLAQRLVLALVMFPHGAQKLFGWFGGPGFSGTMDFFTGTVHLPAPLALLVILGESLGALLLAAGLGTRLAAFGVAAIMAGAVLTTHLQFGFFMNWFGAQQGEGFEFHLLALALAVPLVVRGGGRHALDSAIARAGRPAVVAEGTGRRSSLAGN